MKLVFPLRDAVLKLLENDEDPINSSMRMIERVLKIVGIYNMYGDKRRSSWTPFYLLVAAVNFGCFFYLGILSQAVYLIRMFPDVGETFKALDCLSATCIPLTIYVFLLRQCKNGEIRKVFELSRQGLMTISADGSDGPLRAALRKGTYISWLIIANMGVVHVAYILIPLIFTVFGTRTIPTTPGGPIGLTPIYETPNFEITFIVTSIGTLFSAVNQIGHYILFLSLISHELGHYYSIIERLKILQEHLHKGEFEQRHADEHVEETLKFCIRHHQFLIKYHKAVREMYRGIFGQHYLIMAMVLITTLQTIKMWDIRNTLLTGASGTTPLIIYCFGGELVTSAGEDFTRALQSCRWEAMKPYHRRYVLLMLAISQRPLQLTAADMFPMNRETFGDVVQVVYKVYAVFN